MYPYSIAYWYPPAPVLEIAVSKPSNQSSTSAKIVALVDTGTDGTFIPMPIIERLGLVVADWVAVQGHDQHDRESDDWPAYSAEISAHGLPPRIVTVIPYLQDDYALLGRDVLNGWRLTLDGPALMLRIV